ncbi:MAG: permease [Bacillota bacterium]
MTTALLYIAALLGLAISWQQDRDKTRAALQRAAKSFGGILPALAIVVLLVGLVLALLSPEFIARLMGAGSGWVGMVLTSLIGAVTLIPGFVAFPLAASLLQRGAGVAQIAVFLSTLMMVGVVTAPMEMKYFGRRATLLRNGLAYLYSFGAAAVVAAVVGAVIR